MNNENKYTINQNKAILDYEIPLDYTALLNYLDIFVQRYDFLSFSYIGSSLLGRGIPLIKLGDESAEKAVLYVGTHHGMEWITSVILLRFINEYCEFYKDMHRIYNINMKYLFKSRTIYIVPMLNVDGAELQINGLKRENNPMYDRLLSMNGGENFSRWQANARGVDLNHNYNAGFAEYKKYEAEHCIMPGATKFSGEHPESEPEVGALCNFLRFNENIKMILTLHTQGEEIYYTSGSSTAPKSRSLARLISQITGYSLSEPTGSAAYGGLTDWYIREMNKPSFTLECGKGTNPLPLDQYFKIYASLREALFTSPILI